MNCKNFSIIAFAFGTVILTGCVSDQTAQVNKQNIQRIFCEMQNSPSAKFITAENLRDANAMFSIAQAVAKKNPEAGKKMYKRCAFVAAMQQNKALLKEIVALDSGLKNYNTLIQKDKVPSLLPQLVKVGSVAEASKLAPGKQPVWGAFAAECYNGLSKENADVIASNVNSARESFSAENLLATAKDLAKYQVKANIPTCFTVKQLITEALNLAEISQNKTVLTEIADFTKQNKIFSVREQKELEATVKAASKTRASYVDFRTKRSANTRTYRRNGWNVTKIRLSDGTSVTLRNDGTVSEKLTMFKRAVAGSRRFRQIINKQCKGVNSSYLNDGEIYQMFTALQMISEQHGMSFGVAVKKIIEVAESSYNFD